MGSFGKKRLTFHREWYTPSSHQQHTTDVHADRNPAAYVGGYPGSLQAPTIRARSEVIFQRQY
jgi:hypothetical protein